MDRIYGLQGTGKIRTITGTDPTAGAEVSETVPAGKRWRFISLRAPFVADATVITRNVYLSIDDGTSVFFTGAVNGNITASQVPVLNFGPLPNIIGPVNNQHSVQVTSGLYLLGGFRIKTVTLNIQAGDNYGAPIYSVEEWDA